MKGGYQIISLGDNDIVTSGDGVTIEDVYEKIEGNYKKPILLCDITMDGVEIGNVFTNFISESSVYYGIIGCTSTGSNIVMSVNSDNLVKITKGE